MTYDIAIFPTGLIEKRTITKFRARYFQNESEFSEVNFTLWVLHIV